MGRFDWELSGPMQILLKSCSLIPLHMINLIPRGLVLVAVLLSQQV